VTLENGAAATVKVAEVAADFSTISTKKPSVRKTIPNGDHRKTKLKEEEEEEEEEEEGRGEE